MLLSTFLSYTDTSPQTATLEHIVRYIAKDENLKRLTELYQRTGDHIYKERSPLFAVACRFEGGKGRTHITGLTGLSLCDFDHLSHEQMTSVRAAVCESPFTLLCYTTISGAGLRVIYRYDIPEGMPPDKQRRYYERRAFQLGNAYYALAASCATDEKCKNVTRLSGLAHDPEVYYNPSAQPFTDAIFDELFPPTKDGERTLRRARRYDIDVEMVYEQVVAPELAREGAVFAPGHHNDYIMRLGYKMNAFGIALDRLLLWAGVRFNDYKDTEQVLRSCYQRTEEFNTRRLPRLKPSRREDTASDIEFASMEEIAAFLDLHIRLRKNVVTDRIEYELLTPTEEI